MPQAATMPAELGMALVGLAGAAVALLGKMGFDKMRHSGSNGRGEAVSVIEGQFQGRMEATLGRLTETIGVGNRALMDELKVMNVERRDEQRAHRDEMEAISRAIRDSTQATRLLVDEVEKHDTHATPAMDMVRDLHAKAFPAKGSRRRRR